MTKKYTLKFVQNEFKKVNYTLLSPNYKNCKIKLSYKCDKGHINEITFDNFKQGKRCLNCSGYKKYTLKFVQNEFKKVNYTLLSSKYNNIHSKLLYKCDKGHINEITYGNFKYGYKCPDCSGNKQLTLKFVKNEFKKLIIHYYHPNIKTIVQNYYMNVIKVTQMK